MVSIVLCSAGLAMGQTVWQQYPGNPVIGPGEPGAWDETGCSVLAVLFLDGTYHMWYTSITPEDLPTDIGHATSPNGIDWTRDPANPVLTRGAPGDWDELYLSGAAVIHDGTQFHMWYEGADGTRFRARYATSPDGSAWTKYSGNPVMYEGPPASWDAWGVSPKTVIFDGEIYRMWYAGFGQWPVRGIRIFYAESSDGITWTKHGAPILDSSAFGWDSALVAAPVVIFDGTTYHMWYTGKDVWQGDFEDGSAIGYASSPDGIAWTKFGGNPVVEAITGYAYTSAVVFDGSTYHMWYTYWDGAVTDYVGYATSGSAVFVRFIPAAAVASGAHGSFFQTDVDVSNAGGHSATYHFVWLPRGEDNSDPLTSETFSLGARMSVRYENVLASVFDLEPDALGALSITASSPDLLSMSRMCNLPSAKAAGSYGQSMPAIPTNNPAQNQRRAYTASMAAPAHSSPIIFGRLPMQGIRPSIEKPQ
jgi:hypothetical protein